MISISVLYKNHWKTNALNIFHYIQTAKTKSHEKKQNKFALTGHLHFLYLKFRCFQYVYK